MLIDKTTINKKYKQTTIIKSELYKLGDVTMSKEMRAILDSEREEGRVEGKKEGMIEAFISLVKEGLMNMKDAAKRLGMSEKELAKLIGAY